MATLSSSEHDVERYFNSIEALNREYRSVVTKLQEIAKKKGKEIVENRQELLTQRQDLKDTFIRNKQTTRSLLLLLSTKDPGVAASKERRLKELQDTFRDIDKEYKELGIQMDRTELLGEDAQNESKAAAAAHAHRTSNWKNDDYLNAAVDTQNNTTLELKAGLATIAVTQSVAAEAAQTLAADRDKIEKTSRTLDEIQAELTIASKLITNFAKRMYTDKIIIALSFLIFCGILGIIIYASVKPDQKVFNVPDEVKPPVKLL